jgi:hypothetical protein
LVNPYVARTSRTGTVFPVAPDADVLREPAPQGDSRQDRRAGRIRRPVAVSDQTFLDEGEECYVKFNEKGGGEFHFGYVHGQMDCQLTTRDGEPAVEWT